jgi:hypothetical protein
MIHLQFLKGAVGDNGLPFSTKRVAGARRRPDLNRKAADEVSLHPSDPSIVSRWLVLLLFRGTGQGGGLKSSSSVILPA